MKPELPECWTIHDLRWEKRENEVKQYIRDKIEDGCAVSRISRGLLEELNVHASRTTIYRWCEQWDIALGRG